MGYIVYSEEDKRRLRQTPILEVIEACTGSPVVLTGGGMCRSPFKPGGDSTPSFHIDIAKNVWTDFSQTKSSAEMAASKGRSVNKGGDGYAFVREYLHIGRGEEWRIWETLARCNPSVVGKVVDSPSENRAASQKPKLFRQTPAPSPSPQPRPGGPVNAAAQGFIPGAKLKFKADGRDYGSVRQYHQFQMLSFITEKIHDKEVLELLDRVITSPEGVPYADMTKVVTPAMLKDSEWTPALNVSTLREGLLHALVSNQESDFAKRLVLTAGRDITFPNAPMLRSWDQVLRSARDFLRRRDVVDDWKVRVKSSEVKTEKLTDEKLIEYGTQVRCIPEKILTRYFSQSVETREMPSKKEPGTTWTRTFKNLAFPKSPLTKGEGVSAWNLRGVPYMKDGVVQNIKRNAGSRGPTVTRISNIGHLLPVDAPLTSGNVIIFEGCFDFVSWLADKKRLVPENCEVIVLNSTSNIHHIGKLLGQYGGATMCLDRDDAGKECLMTAVGYFFEGVVPERCTLEPKSPDQPALPGLRTEKQVMYDFSGHYGKGCKDYNERWCALQKRRKEKCRKDLQKISPSDSACKAEDVGRHP